MLRPFQLRKFSRLCNYYYLKREDREKKVRTAKSARTQPAFTKTGDSCSEDFYFFQNRNLGFTRVRSALSSPALHATTHIPTSAWRTCRALPGPGGLLPQPCPELPGGFARALVGKRTGITQRNRYSIPKAHDCWEKVETRLSLKMFKLSVDGGQSCVSLCRTNKRKLLLFIVRTASS